MVKNEAVVMQGLGTTELESGISRVLQSQIDAFEVTHTWLM